MLRMPKRSSRFSKNKIQNEINKIQNEIFSDQHKDRLDAMMQIISQETPFAMSKWGYFTIFKWGLT